DVEGIVLEQVENRHPALVVDVGIAAAERGLVQRDGDQTAAAVVVAAVVRSAGAGRGHGRSRQLSRARLRRIATERAWPSRPSAVPSAIAAGPMAARASALHLRIEVRFMKSST